MRYEVNQSDGSLKKLPNIITNPSSEDINSFKNGTIWVEDDGVYLYTYLKINNNNILINICSSLPPYLEFASDSAFTLSVATPGWIANGNGIIEYSTDLSTWSTWNGSQLSGDESNPIYLRGTGNSIITGGSSNYKWSFTGKYVTGNIETLLDYQTVVNGQHPIMSDYCYNNMFQDCSSLINAPQLPATTLTTSCYSTMFYNCSSLVNPPQLPATTLAQGCYNGMFANCTSLAIPPELPVTTLIGSCYRNMFNGCTSLVNLPQLPATTLVNYCYYQMFRNCTSLKLSTTQDPSVYKYSYRIPTSDTGTTANYALNYMFTDTGGTFTDTPTINTTYYTDHEPI